jgi:hypothetical protein
VQQGEKASGVVSYLNNIGELLSSKCAAQTPLELLSFDIQLQAVQFRAAALLHQSVSFSVPSSLMVGRLAIKMAADVAAGKTFIESFVLNGWEACVSCC